MFTDTHTHPYYSATPEEFIRSALSAEVNRMIMPGVDIESLEKMEHLAKLFPENLRMAIGLHPTEVKENAEEILARMFTARNLSEDFIAIGEIGMDLYWDKTFRDKQMDIFNTQLSIAESADLPVIIHCREAMDETLEILEGHRNVKRVFHSFGGSAKDVERILSQCDDSWFGINGIVTFKNSNLKSTLPAIPINRLLLETDSPYLAPVPYRGKPNQSSYLPIIAQAISAELGHSTEEIGQITGNNSFELFGF